MYHAVERAGLHLLHLHSGCTGFLRREYYLVGMCALRLFAYKLSLMVVSLRLAVLVVVLVVVRSMFMVCMVVTVVRIASAGAHSCHEDC